MVSIQKVTKANFHDTAKLEVHPEQKIFVAENWYSIIEASFEETYHSLVIYADNTTVGYAMYGMDTEDGEFWLVRFMTGKEHQGKGYGGDALTQIIEKVKNLPEKPARLRLSYELENVVAEKFYAKYGFEKTGEIIDGEAVADLWFER
ncbi:GNAT family N-acetyltransferase [Listeria seeligeri]|uniref:GNAT family N-acetyltransferase n=1 Tax=Listeria seeligeri TaxID=1640 RepID=UPI0022EBC02A|nr:GNAT family N-acetyltransferase [Listeria seeligeri]